MTVTQNPSRTSAFCIAVAVTLLLLSHCCYCHIAVTVTLLLLLHCCYCYIAVTVCGKHILACPDAYCTARLSARESCLSTTGELLQRRLAEPTACYMATNSSWWSVLAMGRTTSLLPQQAVARPGLLWSWLGICFNENLQHGFSSWLQQ